MSGDKGADMTQLACSFRTNAIDTNPVSPLSAKQILLLCAKYSGLFSLSRILTSRKTRILAYHGVWLGKSHFGNFLYMSADKFSARMALLEKWGYPVVALTDNMVGKRCQTVITIDDGWYSTWSAMLPVLEKHKYPATIYLTTYYCLNQAPVIDVALSYCFHAIDFQSIRPLHLPVYNFGPVIVNNEAVRQKALATAQTISASLDDDSARQVFLKAVCEQVGIDHGRFMAGRWFHLMNPAEVKDAVGRGVTFEAHTHHHRINYRGMDSLEEELSINIKSIDLLTGRSPEHFCYPSGRYTSDVWPVLEKCGMASATTTAVGLADEHTPRYAIPRILDGQDVSDLEFEAEMSGFMELTRMMRRVRKGER